MKAANETFNRFEIEAWIIRRVGEVAHPELPTARHLLKAEVSAGVTDWNIRKGRIAAQIQRFDLAQRRVGKGTETFAACFERFYGEPLTGEKLC